MNLYTASYRQAWSLVFSGICSIKFLFISSLAVFMGSRALAADYFNPSALEFDGPLQESVDLTRFAIVGGQVPGTYRVDINLNDNWIERRDVTFVDVNGQLQPQFSLAQLKEMGVRLDAVAGFQQRPESDLITDLGAFIPAASSTLDFGKQRLNLSIPQSALDIDARDYLDPQLWDQGLPVLMFNYGYSGSDRWGGQSGGESRSSFLNLRSGANIGPWRLRNYSTYSSSSRSSERWTSLNSYVQRDIHSLKSQLTLGDSYTSSDVFDSVRFQGVQMASDDNMLPDSLRGFAPVIRGIAESNAQVTVRQSGHIIYQAYVAPGAFVISDLYPTSSSGDLEVTIKEANGSERRFVQPFSAVPNMVREGQLKYSATAGRYDSQVKGARTPEFIQGNLAYGLPWSSTLYSGLLGASHYGATALGASHGFGDFGSMSLDITLARSELLDGSRQDGKSYRLQYAKDIKRTGTSFTLAGYRYASEGFYSFQEANEIGAAGQGTGRQGYNKRSKAQLNISQSLAEYGSFYLSGYQQDYWSVSGYERSFSTGYSRSQWGISYNLDYTYTNSPDTRRSDQQLAFSVQIPFDVVLPNSWATYSVNTVKRGDTSQQIGLSGTALADGNLNYNVRQSHSTGNGDSGSLSGTYKGTYGEASAGYIYDDDTQQLNYGAQGAVVVHPYGVTFSQPLGDTAVLVRAPGANGVRVQNQTGVYTDWRGYAVVPYVSTYRKNRIALDRQSLGDEVDIDTNIQTVIPTQGAVVLADFVTRVGSRVMMTLQHQGKPIPLGATASLKQDGQATGSGGIVGGGGELYLSGVPDEGRLQVQWGPANDQSCEVDFVLPPAGKPYADGSVSSVRTLDAVCR